MLAALYWFLVFCVVAGQFGLCYEALVCRGWPPLTEVGICEMCAAPFLVWLPAIFGDRPTRLRGLAVMAVAVAAIFMMIDLNGMVRPSIGHLAGVTGILRMHVQEILLSTIVVWPLVFAVLYFPERVLGDAWRAVLRLPSSTATFSETWKAAWAIGNHRLQRSAKLQRDAGKGE